MRDVVLFSSLAVLWGLSFPAIAVGLEFLPPLLFAAVRYDIAVLLVMGYVVARREEWWPSTGNDLAAIVGGGVFLIAGNGLVFVGQQTVAASVAAILQGLVPIATVACAFLLLDERLSPIGIAGVFVGFIGVGLVVQPTPDALASGDTGGRLIIVGQVTSVALGGVLVQRARPTLDTLPLTGWAMGVGAFLLHGASLAIEGVPRADVFVPTALGSALYLGVFSTAIAYLIYFTILERHGAFQVSLIQYLVPIVATAVGVFGLGESPSLTTYFGFTVIAIGFAIVKRHALVDLVRTSRMDSRG